MSQPAGLRVGVWGMSASSLSSEVDSLQTGAVREMSFVLGLGVLLGELRS